MTSAAGTVVLSARQYQLVVLFDANIVGVQWLPETGPAGMAFVLVYRRKQRKITASTCVGASALFFVERARAGRLGCIIALHLKTIIRQ